jgi:hypothetical protein
MDEDIAHKVKQDIRAFWLAKSRDKGQGVVNCIENSEKGFD